MRSLRQNSRAKIYHSRVGKKEKATPYRLYRCAAFACCCILFSAHYFLAFLFCAFPSKLSSQIADKAEFVSGWPDAALPGCFGGCVLCDSLGTDMLALGIIRFSVFSFFFLFHWIKVSRNVHCTWRGPASWNCFRYRLVNGRKSYPSVAQPGMEKPSKIEPRNWSPLAPAVVLSLSLGSWRQVVHPSRRGFAPITQYELQLDGSNVLVSLFFFFCSTLKFSHFILYFPNSPLSSFCNRADKQPATANYFATYPLSPFCAFSKYIPSQCRGYLPHDHFLHYSNLFLCFRFFSQLVAIFGKHLRCVTTKSTTRPCWTKPWQAWRKGGKELRKEEVITDPTSVLASILPMVAVNRPSALLLAPAL